MVRSFLLMDVIETINKRRAFRSFIPVKITKEIIQDLASCAQIAASCYNNQPWRYVFVHDKEMLEKMHSALSDGNKWAHKSSMIIVVLGKKDDDCVIHDRIYYRFDIGMATAHIILRATELGLVAHPIAGYSPRKTREILGIPDNIDVIALVIVGKHSNEIDPVLSEKQRKEEKERPKRKSIDEFVYINRYIDRK
jgi:nitroreductase